MKGISKYGQFKFKDNNDVDENSISDQSNVLTNKVMDGTKLIIKNGKLQAPLSERSTNIINVDNLSKENVKHKVLTQQKISNLFQKTNHITNNKTSRGKGVEKFDVFSDSDITNEPKKECSYESENTVKPLVDVANEKPSIMFTEILDDNKDFWNTPDDHCLDGNDEFDLAFARYKSCRETMIYMSKKRIFYEKTTSYSKVNLFESNSLYKKYDSDVFEYLIWRESCGIVKRCDYLLRQPQIDTEIRGVIIDWFIDVILDYELSSMTFFLAVSFLDRALCTFECPLSKLQLLGCAALFVASKLEDAVPLKVKQVVYLTENLFTTSQIKSMEKILLRVLNCDLNLPCIDTFFHYYYFFYNKPLSKKVLALIWYLLELSTIHYECYRFLPSRIAAAAFALGIYSVRVNEHKKLSSDSSSNDSDEYDSDFESSIEKEQYEAYDEECWPLEMKRKTQICPSEFDEVMRHLATVHEKAKYPSTLHAMFLKYGTPCNYKVSRVIVMPMRLPFSNF